MRGGRVQGNLFAVRMKSNGDLWMFSEAPVPLDA
jgi:hypothetical protein